MGGEAAKERRRLKRLRESDIAVMTPASPSSALSGSMPTRPKMNNESSISGADAARMRLQRKLARKASGKFKPQAQTERSSPNNHSIDRRRLEDMDENFSETRRSSKRFSTEMSTKDRSSSRKSPPKGKQTPTHKLVKQSVRKEKQPGGKKKPKHLKRKMEHLSKTIAEGNSISDLDNQMQLLQEQIESYKRLKLQKEACYNVEAQLADGNQAISGSNLGNVEGQKRNDGVNENIVAKEPIVEQTKRNAEVKNKRSIGTSGDDSSDEDDIIESFNARSRGKRRRGRRESAPTEDLKDDSDVSNGIKSCPNSVQEHHDKASTGDGSDTSLAIVEGANSPSPIKKTPKKDDKRRCIGRKPITDYVVGSSYTGTVKYIKPKLGAFIDIGSHSDAFCHISCVSDEFVSSVTDVLKVDDVVPNARVVEVDRDKKRITVSLRSEEMQGNEVEMLKSTRQYENNGSKRRDRYNNGEGAAKNVQAKKESGLIAGSAEAEPDPVQFTDEEKKDIIVPERQKIKISDGLTGDRRQSQSVGSAVPSTHSNAGADLKRERKLARRAERRAALDASNGNVAQ